jgi:hypothetical protein
VEVPEEQLLLLEEIENPAESNCYFATLLSG